MRTLLVATALASVFACSSAPQVGVAERPQAKARIDGDKLVNDLQILAADDMEGRKPGTPGHEKARAYIVKRFEESGSAPFDLVVATNILLYYDVFEQSLAVGNIAKMLKPGGFLLTNNRIFELPGSPLSGVGFTDVVYMSLPGIGDTGDRIVWYRKQ